MAHLTLLTVVCFNYGGLTGRWVDLLDQTSELKKVKGDSSAREVLVYQNS